MGPAACVFLVLLVSKPERNALGSSSLCEVDVQAFIPSPPLVDVDGLDMLVQSLVMKYM